MSRFILAFVLVFCCLDLSAQGNIREVDFRNFTFPLRGNLVGHSSLQWLDGSGPNNNKPIQLVDGKDLTTTSSFVMGGKRYPQYEGFTLESVHYASLTGNGNEEAIVDLRYHSGGTQTTDYIYVYTFDRHQPKLLAYCHTGSRSRSGLNSVYGQEGQLVFELLDPLQSQGDCCSSGVLVMRYKWQSGVFKPIGGPERRTILPPHEQGIR